MPHPMSTHICAHHLGWAGMVWDHEFFCPFQIKIVLVWHSCVSMTFNVGMSISSLVVVLDLLYLHCSALADGRPLVIPHSPPSLLVGRVYSLAPKWLNYRSFHTSFFTLSTNHLAAIMVPNFLQPPQITVTLSTNHPAANIIHFLQPPQITVT